MHRNPAGLIPGDDFPNEKAIGHILPVVFDRVGQIEPLHPLNDIPWQCPFGVEIVHGLVVGVRC